MKSQLSYLHSTGERGNVRAFELVVCKTSEKGHIPSGERIQILRCTDYDVLFASNKEDMGKELNSMKKLLSK